MVVMSIPYFSLEQTYNSGQGYRWRKVDSNKFVIQNKDKAIKVNQVKTRFVFDCSEEDFFEIWWNYFDFGTDYLVSNSLLKCIDDEGIKISCNRGQGIHILNPDTWECLVACLINKNPNRTRQIMESIAEMYGTKYKRSMKELGGIKWYQFPSPEEILRHKNIDALQSLTGAYRHILNLANEVSKEYIDLDLLKGYNSKDVICLLYDLGISKEIAKKFCLQGLHKTQIFPLDEPIKEILKSNYMTKDEFLEWYVLDNKAIRRRAGLLYHYLFHDKVNPPIPYEREKYKKWV